MGRIVALTDQKLSEKCAIGDLCRAFADRIREEGHAETTAVAYARDLRVFLVWVESEGGDALRPTRTDLQEFRATLIRRRRAPATINRRLAAIRRWCEIQRALGRLDSDPSQGVPGVEEVDPGPKSLDRRERNALLRAAERSGPRDEALTTILLYAGLRIAEAAALTLDDLELGERSGSLTVRYGKGGKQRSVPLPVEARRALRAWIADRGEHPSRELWIGERGPMTAHGLYQVVKGLADDAGIAVTPHQLRHTYAKLILAGVDAEGRPNQITHVQALLGHKNIKTTARYLAPNLADLDHAVQAALG